MHPDTDLTEETLMSSTTEASFLSDPAPSEAVDRMYATDLDTQGYVGHLTRLWGTAPEALYLFSQLLGLAGHQGGLTFDQRQLLITTVGSAIGDSYCSLAGGGKLAAASSSEVAAAVISGAIPALAPADAALVAWVRRMASDPNSTTQADVDGLRRLGFDDRQIFCVTLYAALRLAFATVNDTLGAAPDLELANRVPPAVLDGVSFGRPPRP